jgi:hypothetical protein
MPNTGYVISVVSKNSGGSSLKSQIITRYTLAAVPEIVLQSATVDSITMSINNNGNPRDTKYRLERSTDGTNWASVEDFTINSDDGETTAYTNSGLNPGTVYNYRIKAKNNDLIETQYSQAVSKITLPAAPTGVTVTPSQGTDDALIISWTASVGADSFDVYAKAYDQADFTKIDSDLTGTMTEHTGLFNNTQYTYFVVAKNQSGISAGSQHIQKYTLAAVPDINSANSGDTNNLTIDNKGNPLDDAENNPDGMILGTVLHDGGDTWTDLENGSILQILSI